MMNDVSGLAISDIAARLEFDKRGEHFSYILSHQFHAVGQ